MQAEIAYLLDLDPDLGAGIDPDERVAARQMFRGALLRVTAGRWSTPLSHHELELCSLGLLIVSGLVAREVRLGDRRLLELLGPGDLLQMPASSDEAPSLHSTVTLTPGVDSELIALGAQIARAGGRWPSVIIALRQRAEEQRARFAVQALITHLSRAEHRLLLMLWHLAERWGIVTPGGIVIPLPLSHDFLGQLTGARRSTATLALNSLEQSGAIRRLRDGTWLLTHDARRQVDEIAGVPAPGRPLGELLATRMRCGDHAPRRRAPDDDAPARRRTLNDNAPAQRRARDVA
jgi:CRP/FNR family cyclic AMP-dependent transcriptional regulator